MKAFAWLLTVLTVLSAASRVTATAFQVRIVDAEHPERTVAQSLVEPSGADALPIVAVVKELSIHGRFMLDPAAAEPQTVDLPDGEHRIEPGGLAFRVAGGAIQSDSPFLVADGQLLTLRLVPVSFSGKDRLTGRATRIYPALRWDGRTIFSSDTGWRNAEPLTVFLVPGDGYEVSSGPVTFSVGASGIGLAGETQGVALRTPWDMEFETIPLWIKTRTGADKRIELKVNDPAGGAAFRIATDSRSGISEGEKDWAVHVPTAGKEPWLLDAGYWMPEARWAVHEPGGNIHDGLTFDHREWPYQALLYHGADETSRYFRFLSAAVDDLHADAGQTLKVRLRFQDAPDRPWAQKVQWDAHLETMRDAGLNRAPAAHPLTLA
ncbi:MAG TPA: hypothetical protein VGA66_04165, partial [Mycobacterium sp.]